MRSRRIYVGILGVVGVVVVCAAAEEKGYELVPHSDSAYAHELFRLQQVDVMKVQLAGAAGGGGTGAENLWKSELILARWEELTKDRSVVPTMTGEYLAALQGYVKSQEKGLDGAWALDHA